MVVTNLVSIFEAVHCTETQSFLFFGATVSLHCFIQCHCSIKASTSIGSKNPVSDGLYKKMPMKLTNLLYNSQLWHVVTGNLIWGLRLQQYQLFGYPGRPHLDHFQLFCVICWQFLLTGTLILKSFFYLGQPDWGCCVLLAKYAQVYDNNQNTKQVMNNTMNKHQTKTKWKSDLQHCVGQQHYSVLWEIYNETHWLIISLSKR